MTPADPYARFPQFYGNPAIRTLASACRWTISGQIGEEASDDPAKPPKRKVPIDVRHLLAGCTPSCKHAGPLRGAFALDETCLLTLDELTTAMPNAANSAFYLQAQTDGLLVLDIEADCPPDVATDLLRLPGILYSERSMSGQGFHLVMPLPKNFYDFPAAAGKRVLREEHGWYELLLDHWSTFTRQPVPDLIAAHVNTATSAPAFSSIEDLYAQLAVDVSESSGASASAVDTAEDMPDIPYAQVIVEQALASARRQFRDPGDFNDDMSRWEFSVLALLYGWLRTQLRAYSALGVEYSAGDTAWLLYKAALDVIPARPKHSEQRNGRPFLLDRAAALVADREARSSSIT
ncbi:hypothetical protein [Streptomyces acidiscabies]|uniref:DNA primase/polymerase bifunctional N-terminal domain-containing protein n=1 Tax=Streptomyces acidiscabies TaxID=42234 RepID=A0ABU4LWF3_9ACTN|nr:hypothetical protein [Streptomyces acidiscabies]MDX3020089.1 hypothetical protein [Streptomyces acidiscabies]